MKIALENSAENWVIKSFSPGNGWELSAIKNAAQLLLAAELSAWKASIKVKQRRISPKTPGKRLIAQRMCHFQKVRNNFSFRRLANVGTESE